MGHPISRTLANPRRPARSSSADEDRRQPAAAPRASPRRVAPSGGDRADSRQRGRYGGPWFQAATSLRLEGGLGHPGRLAGLLVAGARRPRRLYSLAALLMRTPSEVVSLSASEAGMALRRYFDARFLGILPQNRLCRGVLVLPENYSDYHRGRRRQALRTNLRRADRAGIWCEPISDRAAAMAALTEVLAGRKSPPDDPAKWQPVLSRPEITLMVARGHDGRPLALIGAVIDRHVCLIELAVASSYDARWALHDHLARELTDRGVRYLLADGGGPFGALGFEAELHHYQHLLGYELRHLIPVSA